MSYRLQLVTLTVTLGVAACGVDPDGSSATTEATYQTRCQNCHGVDATGTADGPSILNVDPGFAGYVVRHGRGHELGLLSVMPKYTTDFLPDDALAEILDFLDAAPLPTTGEGLYQRLCQNCHGPGGRDGRVGEDVDGSSLNEISRIVRRGHSGTDYADHDYMPAWPSTELSDAQVQLLATYLDQ